MGRPADDSRPREADETDAEGTVGDALAELAEGGTTDAATILPDARQNV